MKDISYNIAGAICVVGLALACAWMEINGKYGNGFGILSGLSLFLWQWQFTKK